MWDSDEEHAAEVPTSPGGSFSGAYVMTLVGVQLGIDIRDQDVQYDDGDDREEQ